MAESAKISGGALRSLTGIEPTKHTDESARLDNITFASRYTKSELQSFIRNTYVAPEHRKQELTATAITPFLKQTHAKVGNKRIATDKMRALAPEIEQSRILVSASIMSPNDLQDGAFIFGFDDVTGIGDDADLRKELSDTFDYFFNKVLNLGVESYDWIGEIMYSSGSKPILILPVATQRAVRDRTPAMVERDKKNELKPLDFGLSHRVGMESFQEFSHRLETEDNLSDYMYSGRRVTWKDVLSGSDAHEDLLGMVPSMEDFHVPSPFSTQAFRNTPDAPNYNSVEYRAGLEDMIVNLRTRLAEGDVIRVSENPEVLRFGVTSKKDIKEMMLGELAKRYDVIDEPVTEELVELDPDPKNYKHEGHPTIIKLPAEAVIPISLFGATSEHLGYFILIDQNGQPLSIENSDMLDSDTGCHSGSPAAAYEAVFGNNCCSNSNRFMQNTQDLSNAGGMMFQYLLEKYLRARMAGIFGRDDLTLSRFNAVSSILFSRLLQRKQTTLVFAPPELLHYFAFDYDHEDGTGLAKTDEIRHLLSLRATYMIAAVMAMANDAIEQKTISFSVDDKNANIEGLMDVIAEVFMGKNKLTGSIDPSEIARDIYSNNLTIVPRNVPGLSDFSIEYNNNASQSTRPDNELIEQISNLIVSHLDVPPAALNQMSEPEFARSVVTNNLFFAKKVARYQRTWCAQMKEFIRSYIRYDIPFKRAILKKLQATGKHSVDENLPSKVDKLRRRNPNVYSRNTRAAILNDVINNFTVALPAPNIVVDTAQMEQIRNFTSNLNEMADRFFDENLIPGDDMEASNGLKVYKAKWIRDELMRFIDNVGGNSNVVRTPDFDNIEDESIIDFIQTFQNIGKHLTQQRTVIGQMEDQSMGGGGDMYGGGDEFGGDEFGGGEDGMGDMDMGDMGAEEEEAPAESESGGSEESTAASMYLNLVKRNR